MKIKNGITATAKTIASALMILIALVKQQLKLQLQVGAVVFVGIKTTKCRIWQLLQQGAAM